MKIAYFDPFSGASGDMILGALVDAGLSFDRLHNELTKLDLDGYLLRAEPAGQHGMHGTRVIVELTEHVHSRTWSTIRELIAQSRLDEGVKEAATAIFQQLANAEAKVHNATPDDVHFHEVGGADAIVDICGACIGLALLGIDEVYAGPPQVGSGFANSAHGIIPVPAPATVGLLSEAEVPIAKPIQAMLETPGELLTPTGAAILATLATFERPAFTPSAVGYGFGTKEFPWPNCLRVWIGELAEGEGSGEELLLETNIDDMNPQFFDLVSERLLQAGALDVWTSPITMKKGRPATLLSVLVSADKRTSVEDIIITNTSTLGVRATPIDRMKAERAFTTVATRWGDVRIKQRGWKGRVIDVAPEYDDCLAIARQYELPIREVWNEAHRIGESAIGTKITGK